MSDSAPFGAQASDVPAHACAPLPGPSIHLAQALALASAQRREAIRQGWPVRIEDAQGAALCETVLGSLEALQNLREDLAFLGYVVVGRGPFNVQVFRHRSASREP